MESLFRSPQEWVRAADEASLSLPQTAPIAADPVLRESMLRASRDNMLAWVTANLQAPGQPVPPNLSTLQLDLARDLVRRGLDSAALNAFRSGQNAAWQRWMSLCFEMTTDTDELRELLAVSATSIATFVDETIAALSVRMDAERDQLTSGPQAERRGSRFSSRARRCRTDGRRRCSATASTGPTQPRWRGRTRPHRIWRAWSRWPKHRCGRPALSGG